jgi:hypothetical protein
MDIALSWSRIAVFRECPYKFMEMFIAKSYPDDSNNPAFVKGKEIHSQVDKYIRTQDAKHLGTIAMASKSLVDTLIYKDGMLYPEMQVAVNDKWQRVGWFSGSIMYRSIYDALWLSDNETKAILIDWKTGKVRPYDDKRGQLHLSAAILFESYPELEVLKCSYNFLEHGKITETLFKREDHAANKAAWEQEALAINETKEWLPKKNKYCHFCLSTTCPLK